jgi:putative ABC transport system permease protein
MSTITPERPPIAIVDPETAAFFAVLAHPAPRSRGVRFVQSLPTALEALRANKGRSVLTTLGIIIGVAAVIVMVALGQGASAQVSARLQGLGTNVLTIIPGSAQSGGARTGAGSVSTLTNADVQAIQQDVPGIVRLSPIVSGNAQVVAGDQNWQTRIQAVAPDYQQIQNWQIAQGSFFSDQDNTSARNVAVLGSTVQRNLFPDGNAVGQVIRIRNVPFTVVGVLQPKGATIGFDVDDVVLIPFRTGQVRLFGPAALNSISVQVGSADELDSALQQINGLLEQRHRIRPGQQPDFSIRNNNDIIQTVEGVSQTLTLLLAGVAAVSLVVGGIGIMNIMLVSVTERTREIGIRAAIGGDALPAGRADRPRPRDRPRALDPFARRLADGALPAGDGDRLRLRGTGGDLLRLLPGAPRLPPGPDRGAAARVAAPGNHSGRSAWSRSASRSSGCSIPTERRTRQSLTASGVPTWLAWLMVAGYSISEATPPKPPASVKTRVRSVARRAVRASWVSKETMPPKPRCWRLASG